MKPTEHRPRHPIMTPEVLERLASITRTERIPPAPACPPIGLLIIKKD